MSVDPIEMPNNRQGKTPSGIPLWITFYARQETYKWAIHFGPSQYLAAEGPFNMCRFANTLFNSLCNGTVELRPQTPFEKAGPTP